MVMNIHLHMKYIRQNKTRLGLTVKDIAYLGVMIATLEAVKMGLSFIPNVEMVTFLLIMYALHFGPKVIYATFAFVGIECLVWGMGTWVFMYLYIWPLLVIVTLLFRKQQSVWFWTVLAGIYGLLFGGLCSLVYFPIGGVKMAFTWWVAGIPYDLLHGVSNAIIMLILYHPMRMVLQKVDK